VSYSGTLCNKLIINILLKNRKYTKLLWGLFRPLRYFDVPLKTKTESPVFLPAYNFYPMEVSHIEHIGIAVKNLEEAIRFYEEILGVPCYAVEEVKDQKVKTAFFRIGQTKIELLESTDPEGPIGKFIEKKGEGLHHMALAVRHIDKALGEVAQKGVKLIDTTPRKGAEGLDIAFLHPKSTFGVLTEFCEDKAKNKA
jgi:methylmalonyl-CoA/ethylmalonyl-CoA epimerase